MVSRVRPGSRRVRMKRIPLCARDDDAIPFFNNLLKGAKEKRARLRRNRGAEPHAVALLAQPKGCATRLSCEEGRRFCAGLLLPSLFVHAEYEEPEDLRCCHEDAEACSVKEQTVAERG